MPIEVPIIKIKRLDAKNPRITYGPAADFESPAGSPPWFRYPVTTPGNISFSAFSRFPMLEESRPIHARLFRGGQEQRVPGDGLTRFASGRTPLSKRGKHIVIPGLRTDGAHPSDAKKEPIVSSSCPIAVDPSAVPGLRVSEPIREKEPGFRFLSESINNLDESPGCRPLRLEACGLKLV